MLGLASVAVAVLGFLFIFVSWRRIDPPNRFALSLSLFVDSNGLKGKAKTFLGWIRRYFRLQAEVLFAARWSLVSVGKHCLFAVGFGCAVFILSSLTLANFVEHSIAPTYLQKLLFTAQSLLVSSLDAISFDLFFVLGLELRPKFPSIEARIIIFGFYALLATLLTRTIFLVIFEVWSIALSWVFPESALRAANNATKFSLRNVPYTPDRKRDEIKKLLAKWPLSERLLVRATTIRDVLN